MMRSVIQFTTAPAGTGKSYRRCAWFITKKWLPENKGVHYSNFPVRFDDWEDGEGKKRKGLIGYLKGKVEEGVIRERVKIIPDEVMQTWRNDGLAKDVAPSGPWGYFDEVDLSGAHVAIDEIHNFCGSTSSQRVKQRWQQWLGEIRHRGATVEGISQHEDKVAKEFKNEAELRLDLVACATRRDPYFKIELYYWYQLAAKVRGEWVAAVAEIESRRVKGRWKETTEDKFKFQEELFDVYDSFSAPVAGGGAGTNDKMPWETRSWSGLLFWFVRGNFERLLPRVAMGLVLCWLCFFGGGEFLMGRFMERAGRIGEVQADEGEKEVAGVAEGVEVKNDFQKAVGGRPGHSAVEQVTERERMAAEDKEEEEKEETIRRAAVVLISEKEVVFDDGSTYLEGDTIVGGIYDGRKVERIDHGKRRVLLEGGLAVGIGGAPVGLLSGLLGGSDAGRYLERAKTGVSPALRNVGGAGGAGPGVEGRNGAKGDAERGIHAGSGIRTLSGERNRGLYSGGKKPGRGPSDTGGGGPTSGGGAVVGGQAAGG